jgi:hypothetical protein
VTVSLGVAMESDSFFMGCYGKWQFLKGLLWKVTVSLVLLWKVTVSLWVAIEIGSFLRGCYGK